MQINSFNFLQSADVSCNGYDKYLKRARSGNWLVFNLNFLFFQAGFFIFHKMYREAFLYSMLFSAYMFIAPKFPILFITLFFFTGIGMSFVSYKLYEMKNNRIMHQVNYQPALFLKAVQPYKPLKSLFVLFLSFIAIGWVFLLSFLMFLSITQFFGANLNLIPHI